MPTIGNKVVEQLSSADFMQRLSEHTDAVIIDVRTAGEFASGHIKGACNVDISSPDFMSKLLQLDATQTYFVYCYSGGRSAAAVGMMQKNGLAHIYELRGGVMSSPNLVTAK